MLRMTLLVLIERFSQDIHGKVALIKSFCYLKFKYLCRSEFRELESVTVFS